MRMPQIPFIPAQAGIQRYNLSKNRVPAFAATNG
jgi:hypothetical protein